MKITMLLRLAAMMGLVCKMAMLFSWKSLLQAHQELQDLQDLQEVLEPAAPRVLLVPTLQFVSNGILHNPRPRMAKWLQTTVYWVLLSTPSTSMMWTTMEQTFKTT